MGTAISRSSSKQQHSNSRSAGPTAATGPFTVVVTVTQLSTTSPSPSVSLPLSVCNGILQPSNTWRCGREGRGREAQSLQDAY